MSTVSSLQRPTRQKQLHVQWKCEECNHQHTSVHDWPGQNVLPTPPPCPECGSKWSDCLEATQKE